VGKEWKYELPSYGEEEKVFMRAIIFEWLYEMGMTITGKHEGKDVFRLTHFGRFFFED